MLKLHIRVQAIGKPCPRSSSWLCRNVTYAASPSVVTATSES